jgi:hypothetical protein
MNEFFTSTKGIAAAILAALCTVVWWLFRKHDDRISKLEAEAARKSEITQILDKLESEHDENRENFGEVFKAIRDQGVAVFEAVRYQSTRIDSVLNALARKKDD